MLACLATQPNRPVLNLENSVDPRRIAQALDSPNYAKKSLITNKVTTIFFATLFKSIPCTLHPRPTEFSRLKGDAQALFSIAASRLLKAVAKASTPSSSSCWQAALKSISRSSRRLSCPAASAAPCSRVAAGLP